MKDQAELIRRLKVKDWDEAVEAVLTDLRDVISFRGSAIMQDAVDMIVLLSAKKVVTGTIQGGVLELDCVPEGVEVDIRDRDCDGSIEVIVDEDIIKEDERGSYFQAG